MWTDLPYRTTVNAACTVTAKEYIAPFLIGLLPEC
jgi:hypothetical protein